MAKWINEHGLTVTDEKNYEVRISNDADNFLTVGDPVSFYTDYAKARAFAIEKSREVAAVELRCEGMIRDPFYDAPVTFWSDRYENGKKIYRELWR